MAVGSTMMGVTKHSGRTFKMLGLCVSIGLAAETIGCVTRGPLYDQVRCTHRFRDIGHAFRGVAATAGVIVAVGDSGRIAHTDRDGRWLDVTSPIDVSLTDVIWTGTTFVAVGGDPPINRGHTSLCWSGVIIESEDARSWQVVEAEITAELYAVAANPTTILAAGHGLRGGIILGITENDRWEVEFDDLVSVTALQWTGDYFVAVGRQDGFRSVAMRSADGMTWERSFIGENSLAAGITTSTSPLIAVGASGRRAAVYTSTDGLQWELNATPAIGWLRGVATDGTRIVAVGSNGLVLVGVRPNQWLVENAGLDVSLYDIEWTQGEFTAVGGDDSKGIVLSSEDGIDWTVATMPDRAVEQLR